MAPRALAISGDNPMMLAAQDPAKVARANRAMSVAYKPALEKISNFDINWNICSYPNPTWAKLVFPNDPGRCGGHQAGRSHLRALARRSRRSGRGLGKHNSELAKRSAWLNEKRFDALSLHRPPTNH